MLSHNKLVTLATKTNRPKLVDAFFQAVPNPTIETANKGATLVSEGDATENSLLLIEGWVAFSKMLPDGEIQIIDVMLPGDFALVGAVDAPVAACSVEALSDARFVTIRPPHINGPAPELATLRELMAGEIVRTQARTSELLLRLGKGSAISKVAYALLELFVRLEAIGLAENARYVLPMTQQKIGEFIGLSNVHVCRTMRRFERDGIISFPTKTEISLDELDTLGDFCGVELDTLRDEIIV